MSKRRNIRLMLAAAAAATVALMGLAGDTTCGFAQSSSCRSVCLQQYNQCRINTKGSPSCDAQYQTCLRACVAPR